MTVYCIAILILISIFACVWLSPGISLQS